MFPINFNFPFRKKDGSITTINDAINAGGGGEPYELPTASASTKGGIKIGEGLTMTGETLSNDNPTPYSLPTASGETLGGVKIGDGLTMTDGVLSNDNPTPYSLPTASDTTLGGVKIGEGISITDGAISEHSENLTAAADKQFTPNDTNVRQMSINAYYIRGNVGIAKLTGYFTSNMDFPDQSEKVVGKFDGAKFKTALTGNTYIPCQVQPSGNDRYPAIAILAQNGSLSIRNTTGVNLQNGNFTFYAEIPR